MVTALNTAAVVACAVLAVARAEAAASLLIWPIDPKIDGPRRATAIWLQNQGREPVLMQVRVFRWTQPDGQDSHAAQQQLVASPPFARIEPGQRQMIRLTELPGARTQNSPEGAERAYRVLLDEVPAPQAADKAAAARIGFRMRYSLPLFVTDGAGAPQPGPAFAGLRCRIVTDGGARALAFTNDGSRHVRLSDVALDGADRQLAVGSGLLGYVLPGARVVRPMPADASGGELLSLAGPRGERVRLGACDGG